MKYQIKAETNCWIAHRDSMFKGKCAVILYSNLSLKEAYNMLLEMFNRYNDTNCNNWGQAVFITRKFLFGANKTSNDGMRMFDYDSRSFRIEEME